MTLQHPVYNTEGKEAGKAVLPEEVFGVAWNNDLVHQVAVSMQANARTPIAHTKNRAEVRGGGRKPWAQKGTGRARHGSSRSPIWRGGGITHGPRNEKDFSKKINKQMRRKALFTMLSRKLKDGEVLFVESFAFAEPKTARAKEMLGNLASVSGFEQLKTKRKNAAFVAIPGNDMNTKKSFSNFGNIEIDEVRNLNVVDLLRKKFLIIESPKEAVAVLVGKTKQKVAATTAK